ncbi:MAG: hypothetical protein AAFR96_08985 [Planctomycetota bacterium]
MTALPCLAAATIVLLLTGCAAPSGETTSAANLSGAPSGNPTATPAGDASADTAAAEMAADPAATARPVVRPAEPSAPRIDPQMTSRGANALAGAAPPPSAGGEPRTPESWQPDWHTGRVIESEGTRTGSAVATNADLLTARRDAVSAAVDMLEGGVIEQTVTRRLRSGDFRVWVQISASE